MNGQKFDVHGIGESRGGNQVKYCLNDIEFEDLVSLPLITRLADLTYLGLAYESVFVMILYHQNTT